MSSLFDPMRIIRMLAFVLRHNPSQFGLDLEPEGWTNIDKLIDALRLRRSDWAILKWPEIEAVIRGSDRFEVQRGRIRATYGHSIRLGKLPEVAQPPGLLFHGTSLIAVANILQHGLSPMTRRFVHLSSDVDWVINFLCEEPQWVIFSIRTEAALQMGIEFRKASSHVWLADWMDPRFLSFHLSNATDAEGIPFQSTG